MAKARAWSPCLGCRCHQYPPFWTHLALTLDLQQQDAFPTWSEFLKDSGTSPGRGDSANKRCPSCEGGGEQL